PPAPAEVTDTAPVMPPPQEDVAVMVPEVSPRPKPRAAPRIAPEAVAPPEPDVRIDDVAQPEVTPDQGAEVQQDPSEATAPEEAATEIVTEAEESKDTAPTSSLRPKPRPARPVEQAESKPAETPKPAATETPKLAPTAPKTDQNAVNDALAAVLGAGQQTNTAPSGPPLTSGEKDALRVAVQQCWNVGSLSTEALGTTVVVSVRMGEDGKPDNGSIRMDSFSGGGDAAARQAFEAARRAIIRCGANGFDLPTDKYDQWRDIEMTFNPESMRIK
ncbi:energy transducer TonB, partial [Roseovarius sp.]|uniref:energy transducer TonB n=1 Tax=Roseovarius sp. TaxID=1486281 RepID=UPI003A97A57C